jgi:hypothetical protein
MYHFSLLLIILSISLPRQDARDIGLQDSGRFAGLFGLSMGTTAAFSSLGVDIQC